MSAISFPSSRSAFSLRLEPPPAKPEGSTMHSKKRPEKALVLFLNTSIEQTVHVTKHISLIFLNQCFSYRSDENNIPKQLCKSRRIMRTAIPARHDIPISIQSRAVTATACSGPIHR